MKSENTDDLSSGGFTPWCIGIVVKDKEFGIDIVKVWPSEKITMVTGNVLDYVHEQNVTYTDIEGESRTDTATYRAWVEAEWKAGEASHLWTSPMVRAGESVQLWRYKDTGKIYWSTTYREPRLRKIERIVYGASNIGVGKEEAADLDSMYYIDYDTLNKELSINTSISDGESFRYKITLCPKENRLTLSDNVGNVINIDSSRNRVSLTDAIGGVYESVGGVVNIIAPGGLNIDASSVRIKGNTTFSNNITVQGFSNLAGGHS